MHVVGKFVGRGRQIGSRMTTRSASSTKTRQEINQPSVSSDSGGILVDLAASTVVEEEESCKTEPAANCFSGVLIPGECHYCCNITTAVKELDDIVFLTMHFEAIKGTPFFNLFVALKEQRVMQLMILCKKSDEAIRSVMNRFNVSSGCFAMCGLRLKPNRRDVQRIFGICDGSKHVPQLNVDETLSRWQGHCFPQFSSVRKGKWNLTKKELFDKILT